MGYASPLALRLAPRIGTSSPLSDVLPFYYNDFPTSYRVGRSPVYRAVSSADVNPAGWDVFYAGLSTSLAAGSVIRMAPGAYPTKTLSKQFANEVQFVSADPGDPAYFDGTTGSPAATFAGTARNHTFNAVDFRRTTLNSLAGEQYILAIVQINAGASDLRFTRGMAQGGQAADQLNVGLGRSFYIYGGTRIAVDRFGFRDVTYGIITSADHPGMTNRNHNIYMGFCDFIRANNFGADAYNINSTDGWVGEWNYDTGRKWVFGNNDQLHPDHAQGLGNVGRYRPDYWEPTDQYSTGIVIRRNCVLWGGDNVYLDDPTRGIFGQFVFLADSWGDYQDLAVENNAVCGMSYNVIASYQQRRGICWDNSIYSPVDGPAYVDYFGNPIIPTIDFRYGPSDVYLDIRRNRVERIFVRDGSVAHMGTGADANIIAAQSLTDAQIAVKRAAFLSQRSLLY